MKAKFSQPLTRRVRLVHGTKDNEEVVELDVSPLPAGFISFIQTVLPDPIEYVNSQPKGVDAARLPRVVWHRNLVLVAKALGPMVLGFADLRGWLAMPEELVWGCLGRIALLLPIEAAQVLSGHELVLLRAPLWVRTAAYLAAVYAFVLWGSFESNAFIYFQF